MKHKLLFFLLLATSLLIAEDYPFDLPKDMTATIDINTSTQEAFNNLLLGTNIHDLSKTDGQEVVRHYDPITIRFPHGLFANWYDWEQDKARVYGTDQFTYTKDDGSSRTVELSYLSSIKTMDNSNLIVGIESLNTLNDEKKSADGKGYDMMWTFNMSADGTDYTNGCPVSVARYQDLLSRGFEVKAIEMGNECFYAGQRSSIIPNNADYIARAKSMYTALKALDPDLKLSIPLERKSAPANVGWNTELTQDTNYFDAVTVHTYVGYDPDDNNDSDEAYATALAAREVLRKTIDDYSKVVAPSKPIWLTEWGVKSGGANAVSALGMADCYMFLSENQDTYERANWFSVNGKLNSHYVWEEVNGKEVIKEPYEKTLFGSTYEIVRSVYENSTMLGSEMTVPTLEGTVNAVNARAVKKDGKTMLLIVNLSDQEVPFIINVDGQRYAGEFEHKAMAFSSMEEEITMGLDVDPLQLIKEGRGSVYLPKYSISTIELKIEEALPLAFVNIENGDVIDKGSDITLEATVNNDFKSVSLWVNDILVSTKTEAPYVWSSFPVLQNMMADSYTFKLVGIDVADVETEQSIAVTTPEQWAYTSALMPHSVPGKIEIEDYDYGGEGIAFYDRTEADPSKYTYREGDNVDLGSSGTTTKDLKSREWLEYTVDVLYSGYYDLAVCHQTRRSPEFEAFSLSLAGEDVSLFSNLICSNTGSSTFAIDTFSHVYLEKGQHILHLDILEYGFDLDYLELIMTSQAIDYFNVDNTKSLNPDTYDEGDEIQYLAVPQDKLGFTFAGWFTNDVCTDTVSVPVISATANGTKTFYAKWTPKSLAGFATIYGDIVEGSVLSVDTSLIENSSASLLYQWVRSGNESIAGASNSSYVISSEDVGSELHVVLTNQVQSGSVISNSSNTIVNAEAPTYIISYNSTEGTDGDITSEIVGLGGHPTFVAYPIREGYVAEVWTNVSGDTLDNQSIIDSDTTLYAQWSVSDRYKVHFHMADSVIEMMTDAYPAYLSQMPNDVLHADSIFDKWMTSEGERFDTTALIFSDLDIYPTWHVKQFALNVSSFNGQVVYDPELSLYDIHSEVKIAAIPNSEYEFTGWSGDIVSSDSVLSVSMDTTINLTANFSKLPYFLLEVFASNGAVVQLPNSSRYISGTMVELTATPEPGYEFESWSGDYVGTENPLSLMVTKEMEIDAIFTKKTASLEKSLLTDVSVVPNPSNGDFTIHLPKGMSATYKLYSMNGKEIQAGEVNIQNKVHIESDVSGMYMLQLKNEHSVKIIKVIVN